MPRRVDAEEERDKILAATIDVISEQGLTGTTMRTIAQRAGCTTGKVTYFFRSREELVVEALRRLRHEAAPRLTSAAAGQSGIAALRSFLLATLPDPTARGEGLAHWRIWLTLWHESLTEPYASVEWDRRSEGYELLLRGYVESAKAVGDIYQDTDTDLAVQLLASLVYGTSVDALLRPHRYSLDATVRLIDGLLAAFGNPDVSVHFHSEPHSAYPSP